MEVREFVGFFLRQKKRELCCGTVVGIVSIFLTLASQKRRNCYLLSLKIESYYLIFGW